MPEPAQIIPRFFALLSTWRRGLIITICGLSGLFTLYTLAGFFLAPWLITKYAPPYATRQLDLQLAPGQIKINPLLFTVEITDLSLKEESQPIFALKRLFVDFELESLFSQAWTFADLIVEDPVVHLAIEADGQLNLARIAGKLPKSAEPEPADKELPGLLLRHLKLTGGSVRLTDKSGEKPVELTSAPVAIELKNISTLANQRGAYTITAALPDGAKLDWQGGMTLKPITASGKIEIKGLKAATVFTFLQDQVNIAEPSGTISLSAGYEFSLPELKPALLINLNKLTLNGLTLAGKDATQPILDLKKLNISEARIDLAARKIALPEIELADSKIELLVNQDGSTNWQNLIKEQPEEPEKPGWLVNLDALSVKNLAINFTDKSRPAPIDFKAQLDLLLSGASIDSKRKEAALTKLAINSKSINLIRGEAGKEQTAKATAEKADPAKAEEQPPWKLALNLFTINGLDLGFVDRQSATPLAYNLTGLQTEITGLALPGAKPIAFALNSKIQQGGALSLKGTVARKNTKIEKIETQITIDRLNLKPLTGLLAKEVALTLVSADLSADTSLRYVPRETKPQLSLTGQVRISNLLLNEDDTGDRFLAAKEIAAGGLDLSLNPDHLEIKEVRLLEPGAKIIIFKDKSVNLAKIRKTQAPVNAEKSPPPSKAEDRQAEPPFPVYVERVRLEKGTIDFADFSLVLPFAAKIEQSRGIITGISTRADSLTRLKIDGRVGEFGQAKAEGSLIPSAPKKFTDIRVIFRNVEMPPLSPYTATFAGRTISGGKLNLDLGYKIKDSELLGDNSVILERFSLGERVESPGAMKLPLDLAIALLTDSDGKIDLSLPIRGNVDHPEFSYGHLVWQTITNVLSKIVTAPFRALASLFGGGGENLDTIIFEPGQADLAPPEQEKLKKVANALEKRKQLKLTVQGGFAPVLDGKALKKTQTHRALASKLGLKLAADEDPGPIAFDNAKTQRALEGMTGGKLTAFEADYQQATGKKAKRINPAMAMIGRASEDRDFYRALFEYLAENTPLAEKDLQELADQRGTAIVRELTKRAGIEADRVNVGPSSQQEEKDKGVPTKLDLVVR
ncbi:MAG TPA: hypothetical protein DEQ20_00335 [Desulfobulbaceae bacterium]|nr:MAG: hypothetical protein A2520_02715 [Deltaproteobacteria bacterium RIFOXYD12_FULL_53_23]HCC53369.1 hypothetical protein [Desulfobulbaceae bacterium]